MRTISLSCVLVTATLLFTSGCWQATDPHETEVKKPDLPGKDAFAPAIYETLANADHLDIYSLEGTEVKKEGFQGWTILGKTAVMNKDVKSRLLESLVKGIKESKNRAALCFDPRHGIRAAHAGRTLDLVICFECGHVYIYLDGAQQESLTTTRSPEPIFDQVLKDAKVPLAPKAKH